MSNPVPNSEPTRFKPGQSGNPAGRPPGILNELKGRGYSLTDVRRVCRFMIALNQEELNKIRRDHSRPMLYRTIASAIVKAYKSGSYQSLYEILALLKKQ